MKKNYIKLYMLEIILLVFLILNSFVSSVLSKYNLVICLILLLILFKKLFGFEKNGYRFTKDIIIEVLIFMLMFFIVYYLMGLFVGFYRPGNFYNFNGLRDFIFPTIVIVILREILRYNILSKAEDNKLLVFCTIMLFVFLEVTSSSYYGVFNTNYDIFCFISLALIPAISYNILCSYIVIKVGYKPAIVYSLIAELCIYILPIIPNMSEYILSIVKFVVPIIFMVRLVYFFSKSDSKVNDKRYSLSLILLPTGLITIFLVYFVSGYFHFYAIAIAGESMSPKIDKGDVVVIEKLDGNYNLLKENQVIAYKHDNSIVVHRLVDIVRSSKGSYYYTKSDINSDIDAYVITDEDIIGIVKVNIPYIGLPTVWLNEL